jgi:hypothetical protein
MRERFSASPIEAAAFCQAFRTSLFSIWLTLPPAKFWAIRAIQKYVASLAAALSRLILANT